MVERFVRWFLGYLFIYVKGEDTTRFINLCNSNAIHLWNIRKNQTELSCYISLKQYRRLKNISKKCRVIPYIRKRTGFPFFIYRIQKRKILFAAILLFLAFIYILSLYIWNIDFEGNYLHTDEQLQEFLQDLSVHVGTKKTKIDSQLIESNIRKNYPDIGWVSVELKGTKLSVRLVETTMPEPAEKKAPDHFAEADISADKEGIIMSILVRLGTPKVKKGDIVRKGDVLVSGIVPAIGDSGEPVSIRRVIPDADITMKTAEKYYDEFTLHYDKKVYTGIEKSGYDVILFGNNIFSYLPGNSYLEYDIIRELVHLKINKNFYLPFMYQKTTYKEYYIDQKVYSQEEAMQIAVTNLEQYLNDLEKQGIKVDSIDTKTEILNGRCITRGQLILLEPAYTYTRIP